MILFGSRRTRGHDETKEDEDEKSFIRRRAKMYARNGKKFFHESQVENGVWHSRVSWQPFWGVKGDDGNGSWCVDRLVALLILPQFGVKEIRKMDERNGIEYSISYDKFIANCVEFNAGYGEQCAVPIELWDAEQVAPARKPRAPKQKKIKVLSPVKPVKSWLQGALFK